MWFYDFWISFIIYCLQLAQSYSTLLILRWLTLSVFMRLWGTLNHFHLNVKLVLCYFYFYFQQKLVIIFYMVRAQFLRSSNEVIFVAIVMFNFNIVCEIEWVKIAFIVIDFIAISMSSSSSTLSINDMVSHTINWLHS